MKTDRQLKQEVDEELDYDPAVNAVDIGVEVKERVVTLSGHPSSYAEKIAAEKAAQRVAKHIQVDVRDGTVTLKGKVGSYAERSAARGAARSRETGRIPTA